MTDRGDYRSFYCSFWDDPDLHGLSHAAYRVLTTLKGSLPAAGIGVVYLSTLADRCNMTVPSVEAAIQELAEPKPGADLGWVVREKNVVWIVNALRYEPTLTCANEKHRTFLRQRVLAPLGDRRPIVVAFRRYYADWFPGAVPDADAAPRVDSAPHLPNRKPKGTSSDAAPMGIGSQSKQTPAQPSPNLSYPSQSSPSQALAAAARIESLTLAVWANQAIAEKFGEQPNPLTPATAIEASTELTSLGVDPEVAHRSIFRQTRETLQRPPRSVKYYLPGIKDDWSREIARRATAANGDAAPLNGDPTLSALGAMLAEERAKEGAAAAGAKHG